MYFENSEKQYIAFIGDILYSKRIESRNEVQNKLKSVIGQINNDYSEDLASKFMITLGDEFQGLLLRGRNTIQIIEKIEYEMYPVKIRFGLGIGEIRTDIIYEMPLGADGPAYYNAREMIDGLKTTGERLSGNNIKIKSNNYETDLLLNTVFSLLSVIKDGFTKRQREIVHFAFSNAAKQSDIAREFKIYQSTVNGILKSANYYQYREAMKTLEKIMGEIDRDV
ncbi:MAG: SatD family protein [Clostridiales bacterium]|nr:SatD family protein [Clostridiales bacterium]